MRKGLVILFCLVGLSLSAQITAPDIQLTGNIGPGANFPLFNHGTLVLTDANLTMTYPMTSASIIRVTSSVSLTATRTITAPQTFGFEFIFQNATTGGHDIVIQGPTGTGVTIPYGQAVMVISDGINYVSVGAAGGGTSGSVPFSNITAGTLTNQHITVSTGALLDRTGTGSISANQINGASMPISATALATNASGQIIVGSASGGSAQVVQATGATPLTIFAPDMTTSLQFQMTNGASPKLHSSTGGISIDNLFVSSLAGTGTSCLHADAAGNVTRTGSECGSGGGGSATVPGAAGDMLFSNGSNGMQVDTGVLHYDAATKTLYAPSIHVNATSDGYVSYAAGTGTIPALPANSMGFSAPPTGGTSGLIKLPATLTAGVVTLAAPAIANGVNQSQASVTPVATTATANALVKTNASGTIDSSFVSGLGGGNVSSVPTPTIHQTPVWASGTTLKGVGPGTAGQVWTSGGASADPSWQNSTGGSGNLSAGTPAPTTHQLGIWQSSTVLGGLGTGTAGQVLTSGGTSADPSWQNATGGSSFSAITAGTNTAALTIGAGGSLTSTGTGHIDANWLKGYTLPTALPTAGTGMLEWNGTAWDYVTSQFNSRYNVPVTWSFVNGTTQDVNQSMAFFGYQKNLRHTLFSDYVSTTPASNSLSIADNQITFSGGNLYIRLMDTPVLTSTDRPANQHLYFNSGNKADVDIYGYCTTLATPSYGGGLHLDAATGNFNLNPPCSSAGVTAAAPSSHPIFTIGNYYWNGTAAASLSWNMQTVMPTTLATAPAPITRNQFRIAPVSGQLATFNTLATTATQLDTYTFASLAAFETAGAVVGTTVYCSNCGISNPATCSDTNPSACVCVQGTSGQFAKYENYMNGGNHWYCAEPGGAGATAGSASLSSLTAATATSVLNNGSNRQDWNWTFTGTASNAGLAVAENVASTNTGTSTALMGVGTMTGSTISPFGATAHNGTAGLRVMANGDIEAIGTSKVIAGGDVISDTQMIAPQFTVNPSPIKPITAPLGDEGDMPEALVIRGALPTVPTGRNAQHTSAFRILSPDNLSYLDINVPDSGNPTITSSTGGVDLAGGGGGTGPVVMLTTATTYDVTADNFAKCVTIAIASSNPDVRLPPIMPPSGQCIWVINYGVGSPAVVPTNSIPMNGQATSRITMQAAISFSRPTIMRVTSTGTNNWVVLNWVVKPNFADLIGGTLVQAPMLVGNGSSLTSTGTGWINANRIDGHVIPGPVVGAGNASYLHWNGFGFVWDTSTGTASWSALTAPSGDLGLNMGGHNSTFGFNLSAPGASNGFSLEDDSTTNPSSLKNVLNLTSTSSNVRPLHVTTSGNNTVSITGAGDVTISKLAHATSLATDANGTIIPGIAGGTGAATLVYSRAFSDIVMTPTTGPIAAITGAGCSGGVCTVATPAGDTTYSVRATITQVTNGGTGCTNTGNLRFEVGYRDADSDTDYPMTYVPFLLSGGTTLQANASMGLPVNSPANMFSLVPMSFRVKHGTSLRFQINQFGQTTGCSQQPTFTVRVAFFQESW